jgi:Membrane-bound serine protease (ClpP class)
MTVCWTALGLLMVTTVHAGDTVHKGDVVVVPLRGEVAPSLLAFLRRAVKTAESNEASAIIFDMNTYGGRLDTATDIVNALNQTKIPTYTFINTNAGSAGSLIAIATQRIYMAPVSAIGAASTNSARVARTFPLPQRRKRFRTGLRSSVVPRRRTGTIRTSPKRS